jgi:hypothetical protein
MKRVMIDIETLDIGPNSVVTAIGAVIFDELKILDSFCSYLDYTKDKGTINPSTLRWWLKNEQETLDLNLNGVDNPNTIAFLLQNFVKDAEEIWANSPSFDCTILRNWFGRLNLETPWAYYSERDCRTMFAMGEKLNIPRGNNTKKHDALSDAVWQAAYLMRIEARIYNWATQ